MQEALNNFLFGLTFGMGFSIASTVLKLVASLLSKSQPPTE